MIEYSLFYKGDEENFRQNYLETFRGYGCLVKDYIRLDEELLVIFSGPTKYRSDLEKIAENDEDFSHFETHPQIKMISSGPHQSEYPKVKF